MRGGPGVLEMWGSIALGRLSVLSDLECESAEMSQYFEGSETSYWKVPIKPSTPMFQSVRGGRAKRPQQIGSIGFMGHYRVLGF